MPGHDEARVGLKVAPLGRSPGARCELSLNYGDVSASAGMAKASYLFGYVSPLALLIDSA